MYEGQATMGLSWAEVRITVKCENKAEGSRPVREDTVADAIVLGAQTALQSEAHRFAAATRLNGDDSPVKQAYTLAINNGGLSIQFEISFSLKCMISHDNLTGAMLQSVIPAISVAAGSHFGKPAQAHDRMASLATTMTSIEELVGPATTSGRSRQTSRR